MLGQLDQNQNNQIKIKNCHSCSQGRFNTPFLHLLLLIIVRLYHWNKKVSTVSTVQAVNKAVLPLSLKVFFYFIKMDFMLLIFHRPANILLRVSHRNLLISVSGARCLCPSQKVCYIHGVFLLVRPKKLLSVRLHSKSHQKSFKCRNLLTEKNLWFLGGGTS